LIFFFNPKYFISATFTESYKKGSDFKLSLTSR